MSESRKGKQAELRKLQAGEPFYNNVIGARPGFVAGECGHAVAESEWRAGFRVCERCPAGGEE